MTSDVSKKIFRQCREGDPGIRARKEWSRFTQESKKKEQRYEAEICQYLIEGVKIQQEPERQERGKGQEQKEEEERPTTIQGHDSVNSKEIKISFKRPRR